MELWLEPVIFVFSTSNKVFTQILVLLSACNKFLIFCPYRLSAVDANWRHSRSAVDANWRQWSTTT